MDNEPDAPPRTRVDETFYKHLPTFDRFRGFSDAANYHPVPDDWYVVLGDIEGSTDAIAEGRYKDVNMMGAACITAVLNALDHFEPKPDIPYVFGGDGATLLVPPYALDNVRKILLATQSLSKSRFNLPLRIGIVPVADVRARGKDIHVAKFELSPGNHLALFNGGGVEDVDVMVKDEETGAQYRATPSDEEPLPDLEGLSCRWSPITSRKGLIISLLVVSRHVGDKAHAVVYARVLQRLRDALGEDISAFSPANDENLVFRWPPPFMETELKAIAGQGFCAHAKVVAKILFESAFQYCLHKWDGSAGGYNAPVYKREMIANTDFRKFDDVLRLVLDCTEQQIADMEEVLEQMRSDGEIAYGIHTADSALMTCLVFSLESSQHVHFMDGGDGGFAIAAKQLKAQLAEEVSSKDRD